MNTTNARNRWTGVTLLGGAAAAAAFALMATSPLASADPTADVPVMPVPYPPSITDSGAIGLPPFWDGYTYTANAQYVDLVLGDHYADTVLFDVYGAEPAAVQNAGIVSTEALDLNGVAAILATGTVEGSTFDHISTGSLGWDNYYELTPFLATGATKATDNVNDTLVFDPNGLGTNNAGIDFGIQYLDLPNAATPVDEINFLGSGGEILFSIPVTGDLLAGL